MILTLLTLHARQLGRLAGEIGGFRSLVLLALLAFTLARVATLEPPLTYAVATLLVFLLASLHVFRKDNTFLKIVGAHYYGLYATEYHLLVSPFYGVFLLQSQWLTLLGMLVAVSLVPLLRVTFRPRTSGICGLPLVPPEAFEWKSGLRRYGVIIGSLYFLALVCYPYPFVALAVVVVFTLLVTTFYNESESRLMVDVYTTSPRAFLLTKWRIQLTLFWAGCAPLLLIFALAYPKYWYVLLVLFVVSSIIQVLGINLKYSLYEPGRSLNKDIFMAIYFLSLFVPYFVPVPLAMAFHYYRRAHRNLQTYLDDSY